MNSMTVHRCALWEGYQPSIKHALCCQVLPCFITRYRIMNHSITPNNHQLSQPIIPDATATASRSPAAWQWHPCTASLPSKPQSLATLSPAVPGEKIPVPVNILKEETRKMDTRICTRNGPQLGNDLLECILFRKHIK